MEREAIATTRKKYFTEIEKVKKEIEEIESRGEEYCRKILIHSDDFSKLKKLAEEWNEIGEYGERGLSQSLSSFCNFSNHDHLVLPTIWIKDNEFISPKAFSSIETLYKINIPQEVISDKIKNAQEYAKSKLSDRIIIKKSLNNIISLLNLCIEGRSVLDKDRYVPEGCVHRDNAYICADCEKDGIYDKIKERNLSELHKRISEVFDIQNFTITPEIKKEVIWDGK